MSQSFFDLEIHSLDGKPFDIKKLRGKKLLIVNTASACGLTPQYAQLQELYAHSQNKNFEILAFPCNDFAGQEPGSAEQIAEFCSTNYGVTFPIMEKVKIKSSPIHPVYEWLTQKSKNGVEDSVVEWNFHKYLIDENGNYVASIAATESPLSEQILSFFDIQ